MQREGPGEARALQIKAPLKASGSETEAFWRGAGLSLPDLTDTAALHLGKYRAAPELQASVSALLLRAAEHHVAAAARAFGSPRNLD